MESNLKKPYVLIVILSLTLMIVFACSTPTWSPIKKGPPHKAKTKELLDKEVIIIDRHEYVKVTNPRATEGGNEPKYLYIPVEEYLSKKEAYTTPSTGMEKEKRASAIPQTPYTTRTEGEVLTTSTPISPSIPLKKKVLIAHFDDRITTEEEILGDWLAEKLMKEMARRDAQILFMDYQMVKEFLEKGEASSSDLGSPKVSKILSEVFGIHAIVQGKLTGPYVFTTKGGKDHHETSTAVVKMEVQLLDTFTGKILKTLSAQNAIHPTKQGGLFSDEKAKGKAFEMILSDLSRSLLRELDRLEWFCRVAKVEGEEVYLNAGKLSGLRVGDEMEIFRPGKSGERGEIRGRIQISTVFGLDASIGRIVQGNPPQDEDILRLVRREGT